MAALLLLGLVLGPGMGHAVDVAGEPEPGITNSTDSDDFGDFDL